IEPVSFSFEDKIALALQGSSWQDLQTINRTVEIPQQTSTNNGGAIVRTDAIQSDPEAIAKALQKSKKQLRKKEQFDKRTERDAGDYLQSIALESIVPVIQNVTWEQEPEVLCSYNWQAQSDNTNTIYVPGAPAKWQPPPLPHTLDQDSGWQTNDHNYARKPRTPYEPMFHALNAMNPSCKLNDVDVLADRNNLRVLLEFVQGKVNGPFRLDLFTMFSTLIIVRNEGKWWKFSDGKSYGSNFEKFFTRPAEGMEDATSHYRAIKYPMGPLNVVVRFEADGYDDGVQPDQPMRNESAVMSGGHVERPVFKYGAPMRVLQKGHIVPMAQMIEMKTKAYYAEKGGSLVQCQDQLWFGRTSLLYTGPCSEGTGLIKKVKYENATERVKKWEASNQESLRKLVSLLAFLRHFMQQQRLRAVVLVREEKNGPLTLRSMENGHLNLGSAEFMKFWRREGQHGPGGSFRGQRGGR
ncbi:hypothetical protein EK21DRAFT_29186, partial [Setomelanomma holmii]